MYGSDLIIALREEIGSPLLFTGREKELNLLLNWVDLVKDELGDSKVLLARKRRGKTALVQRFFISFIQKEIPRLFPSTIEPRNFLHHLRLLRWIIS